jgi:hypothetical protein
MTSEETVDHMMFHLADVSASGFDLMSSSSSFFFFFFFPKTYFFLCFLGLYEWYGLLLQTLKVPRRHHFR